MVSIAAMPRALTIACAIGAACAAILAGCGGGDKSAGLPPREAEQLIAILDQVEANADVGSCAVAQTYASDLSDQIATLPQDVDPGLRQALEDAAARLDDLLGRSDGGCGTEQPEQTNTETSETTEATETTETTETSETTQPTQTTETQPPPPTETTPTTPTDGNGSGGTGL